MQPNRTATPWDSISSVVTVLSVIAVLLTAFGALVIIPSSGASMGDFALTEHVCSTVTHQDVYNYEGAFGDPDPDGVRSAPLAEAFCRPFDAFEHPIGARLLLAAETWAFTIPALILLRSFRRIIRRTSDKGPFSAEAVRLLSGWRWWAAGTVAAAGVAHWVVEGIKNTSVAGEGWPGVPSIWPAIATVIAVRIFVGFCESGVRQTQDAYERGLAAQPPVERPVD